MTEAEREQEKAALEAELERDRVELVEAVKALHTAEIGAVRTDAAVATIHRASADIQTIVSRNGYVARFRELLRGA